MTRADGRQEQIANSKNKYDFAIITCSEHGALNGLKKNRGTTISPFVKNHLTRDENPSIFFKAIKVSYFPLEKIPGQSFITL